MTEISLEIQQAFRNHQMIDISTDSQGNDQIETVNIGSQFFHWGDTPYHQERVQRIAKVLTKSLQKLPPLPIQQSMKDPVVTTTRLFLRSIDKDFMKLPKIQECLDQLLAAKLGIEYKHLAKSKTFKKFAKDNHLEKYLLHYGHNVSLSAENQEIQLISKGSYRPWSSILEEFESTPYPTPSEHDNPKQPWYYGTDGIQTKDMYIWKKLEPYKIEENPSWGNRYILSYRVCCGETKQMNGDHSWLQLKTPNGEIYSVGLYRPGKDNFFDNFSFPMRAKKGYLMSPDVSEFWPSKIYEFPVEISKEQFEMIKKSIEEDKREERHCVFQLFNGNCTEYINSKFRLIGIELPTAVHFIDYATPESLKMPVQIVFDALPLLIQKICDLVFTFFTNLALLALGTSMIDDELHRKNVNVQRHISHPFDLFDRKKTYFHPPREVALGVCPMIEKWKEDKIDQLRKSHPEDPTLEAQIERIKYSVPNHFRKKSQLLR